MGNRPLGAAGGLSVATVPAPIASGRLDCQAWRAEVKRLWPNAIFEYGTDDNGNVCCDAEMPGEGTVGWWTGPNCLDWWIG